MLAETLVRRELTAIGHVTRIGIVECMPCRSATRCLRSVRSVRRLRCPVGPAWRARPTAAMAGTVAKAGLPRYSDRPNSRRGDWAMMVASNVLRVLGIIFGIGSLLEVLLIILGAFAAFPLQVSGAAIWGLVCLVPRRPVAQSRYRTVAFYVIAATGIALLLAFHFGPVYHSSFPFTVHVLLRFTYVLPVASMTLYLLARRNKDEETMTAPPRPSGTG